MGSNRGPWDMTLVVHGFPNDISALRFEWAWQHPKSSRRLNSLPGKKASEKRFDYELRLLACMLRMGPWDRLPLTIQWLLPDYQRDFPPTLEPPLHMPICVGPVKSTKPTSGKAKTKSSESEDEELIRAVVEPVLPISISEPEISLSLSKMWSCVPHHLPGGTLCLRDQRAGPSEREVPNL